MATLAAAALLGALVGCGSDSSGQDSTASTAISIQSPTSPIPVHHRDDDHCNDRRRPEEARETTNTTGGSAPPCSIPDAYQDFKFTGLDCTAAVGVATAWDQNGKTCNTVDNPDVADRTTAHLLGRGLHLHR